MFSLRNILLAAPLLAVAIAQNVAFTSTPGVVDAGSDFNITWAGGDGSSVTLTLRRGNPQDLDTVGTIASNVEGYSYLWTVPTDLEAGSDYALQITQGQSDINWTGLFSIEGGSANATTTSNSTMSITSAASASGTGTAMSRNVTFSTASLSTTNSVTFGSMTSSRTASATASETSAPNSNSAPIKAGSSVALIFGIVAAVMLH